MRPILPFLIVCAILAAWGAGPLLSAGERYLVSQKGRTFAPREITIQPGDVVVFQNDDRTSHHIMSRKGPTEFSSRLLPRGASYEVTFEEEGTWEIGCHIHPRMRLMVDVQAGPAAGQVPAVTESENP